ncbi:MAG: hypothetical protein H0W83_15675, partial [Planctomycetes bacterium]|nr:hypothetical protein [Planctomycetota bacterium]
LALAATLFAAGLWQRHRRPVALVIAAIAASAVLCHGWGWSLQTRMLQLLASLRAGTTEGSGWGDFEHMHRMSERVMGAETAALLALTLLLAWLLMRLAAPLPSSTRSATV